MERAARLYDEAAVDVHQNIITSAVETHGEAGYACIPIIVDTRRGVNWGKVD